MIDLVLDIHHNHPPRLNDESPNSALERGPTGEPSATDFIVTDLPPIVEQFAVAFNDLPEAMAGLPAIRMLIGTGALVRAFRPAGTTVVDTRGQCPSEAR